MEMGSCDLSHIFKKEISKYNAVREPGRVMYWKKMLEAVKAIHDLGRFRITNFIKNYFIRHKF